MPECLSKHQCLILSDAATWEFELEGAKKSVRVSGRMRTDCGEMIVAAAMEGLGIGCLSRRIAEPLIATGRPSRTERAMATMARTEATPSSAEAPDPIRPDRISSAKPSTWRR